MNEGGLHGMSGAGGVAEVFSGSAAERIAEVAVADDQGAAQIRVRGVGLHQILPDFHGFAENGGGLLKVTGGKGHVGEGALCDG